VRRQIVQPDAPSAVGTNVTYWGVATVIECLDELEEARDPIALLPVARLEPRSQGPLRPRKAKSISPDRSGSAVQVM